MKTLTHIIDLTENVDPVQEDWSIEKWNTGLYEAVQVNGTKIRILCTDRPDEECIVGHTINGAIETWYKDGVFTSDRFSTNNLRLIRKQPECIEVVKYQYFDGESTDNGCWQLSQISIPEDTTEIKLIYRLPKK